MTDPTPLPAEAVEAALAAYEDACQTPRMVECARCKGKGYHHGFGETGHDPDWCSSCGGGGYELAEGEDRRPMRAALAAALPHIGVGEATPDIEVWAKDEYREGVSAGAAARQLCRLLGAYGAAPTLKKMLEDMLSAANFASHDRHMILADFGKVDAAAAQAARMASFCRWNPHAAAPEAPQ